MTYFDSFGVEHISKEITKIHRKQNIITNIYRILDNVWILLYYWFYVKRQKFFRLYLNLFYPNYFEKNDKIIPKYSH